MSALPHASEHLYSIKVRGRGGGGGGGRSKNKKYGVLRKKNREQRGEERIYMESWCRGVGGGGGAGGG